MCTQFNGRAAHNFLTRIATRFVRIAVMVTLAYTIFAERGPARLVSPRFMYLPSTLAQRHAPDGTDADGLANELERPETSDGRDETYTAQMRDKT